MIGALLALVVTLVDPATVLTAQPPLAPPAGTAPRENDAPAFRQRVTSRELVTTGIDASGRPVSVTVEQHLTLTGTGDYEYSVPAPVLSVSATRDSQSAPGRRAGAILWAGFSDRRRTLGERARLDPRAAAPLLPLQVQIRGGTVTIGNATAVDAPSASATPELAPLQRALAAARRGVFPHGGVAIPTRGTVGARTAHVEAPLRVTGTIGSRRVETTLGDGRPLVQRFRASGPIRLTVQPVPPSRSLTPPPELSARATLALAEDGFLRAARAQQYQTFLANPGPPGAVDRASYVFVSAADPTAPPAPASSSDTLAIALTILGGVLLAGLALVAWAHL